MTHHTMNQMGHNAPNLLGVRPGDLAKRVNILLPGYMTMGEGGMGEMGKMGMPVPRNGSFEQLVGKSDRTSHQIRSWFSCVFACHKLQEFATGCVIRHMMS